MPGSDLLQPASRTGPSRRSARSEEHTSELQSRQYLVFPLFVVKKTDLFARHDTHCAATASAVELLQALAQPDLVVSSANWVSTLSQLLGLCSFLWFCAISPTPA